ncbi:MAG: hypothetical protein HIU84_01880 [Acidobacteria bacterium]|nr:hypothetical protein [Acidobacteriota bacterium]
MHTYRHLLAERSDGQHRVYPSPASLVAALTLQGLRPAACLYDYLALVTT